MTKIILSECNSFECINTSDSITEFKKYMIDFFSKSGPVEAVTDLSSRLQYAFASAAIYASIPLTLWLTKDQFERLETTTLNPYYDIMTNASRILYASDKATLKSDMYHYADTVIQLNDLLPGKTVIHLKAGDAASSSTNPNSYATANLYVAVRFLNNYDHKACYGATLQNSNGLIRRFASTFTAPRRDLIRAESFIADSLSEACRKHYLINPIVFLDSLKTNFNIPDTECSAEAVRLADDLAEISN